MTLEILQSQLCTQNPEVFTSVVDFTTKPFNYPDYLRLRTTEKPALVMLPLVAVTAPQHMLTEGANLAKLKNSILQVLASGDSDGLEGVSRNGILDPVWIVKIKDSFHIANGFHRFEILKGLAEEGRLGRNQTLYSLVIPGDEDLLWRLRLIGAGDHTNIAPARMITFFKESLGRRYPGISFILLARQLDAPDAEQVRNCPPEVSSKQFINAIASLKTAAETVNMDTKTVQDVAELAEKLDPSLTDKITKRSKPRGALKAGQLPFQVAKTLVGRPELTTPKGKKRQLEIVASAAEMGLTIPQVEELIVSGVQPKLNSNGESANGKKQENGKSPIPKEKLVLMTQIEYFKLDAMRMHAITLALGQLPAFHSDVLLKVFISICKEDLLLELIRHKEKLSEERCLELALRVGHQLVEISRGCGKLTTSDYEITKGLLHKAVVDGLVWDQRKRTGVIMPLVRSPEKLVNNIPVDLIVQQVIERIKGRLVPVEDFQKITSLLADARAEIEDYKVLLGDQELPGDEGLDEL